MATAHRCGWVALMGPPNAGKSTLTNALVGQKVAIVTAKPQTTRNRIVGILTQKDAQVIFMDTPGVHALRGQTRGQLGKIMVQSAWQSFAVANCIVLVIDGDLYLTEGLASDAVQLNDVYVKGTIIVAGGTVTMTNTMSDHIVVSSPMGRLLQVTAAGAARFPSTEVRSTAVLYEKN